MQETITNGMNLFDQITEHLPDFAIEVVENFRTKSSNKDYKACTKILKSLPISLDRSIADYDKELIEKAIEITKESPKGKYWIVEFKESLLKAQIESNENLINQTKEAIRQNREKMRKIKDEANPPKMDKFGNFNN